MSVVLQHGCQRLYFSLEVVSEAPDKDGSFERRERSVDASNDADVLVPVACNEGVVAPFARVVLPVRRAQSEDATGRAFPMMASTSASETSWNLR